MGGETVVHLAPFAMHVYLPRIPTVLNTGRTAAWSLNGEAIRARRRSCPRTLLRNADRMRDALLISAAAVTT